MKLLLTGATGQLGLAIAETLNTHELVPFSRQQLDITKPEDVNRAVEREKPDIIINCAAYTHVDEAEENVEKAFLVNETGPRILAEAAKNNNSILLHFSTDYVFDGRAGRPYNEDDQPNPLSVYGKSKLAGERAIQEIYDKYFIVRTSWLFHHTGKNFLRTMYNLASRDEVRVVDDQYGSPTYAPHLAMAVGKVINTDQYGLWHLAGSGHTTWFDLTTEFYKLLGITTPVIPVPTSEFPRPAQRPKCSTLITSRIPPIELPPWQKGVEKMVAEIRSESSNKS